MNTSLEFAIEVVGNLQEIMIETLNLAKMDHDNLKAKELRSVIEGIQLSKDALFQVQSTGEIK